MPHPSNLGFVEKTLVGIDVDNSNINEKVLAKSPNFITVPCPTLCPQGDGDTEFPDELYIHFEKPYTVLSQCIPPCFGSPVNPCFYCHMNPLIGNDDTQDPPLTGGVIGMIQVGYYDIAPPAGRCYCGVPGETNFSTTGCCWCFGAHDPDSPFAKPPTECDGVAFGVPFGDLPQDNSGVLYQSGAYCAPFGNDFFGWLITIMVSQCPDVDDNVIGHPGQTCLEVGVCGLDCNGIPPNVHCRCNPAFGGEIVFFTVYFKPNVRTTNHQEGTPVGLYSKLFSDFLDPEDRTCGGFIFSEPLSLIVDTDPNPHPFIPPPP